MTDRFYILHIRKRKDTYTCTNSVCFQRKAPWSSSGTGHHPCYHPGPICIFGLANQDEYEPLFSLSFAFACGQVKRHDMSFRFETLIAINKRTGLPITALRRAIRDGRLPAIKLFATSTSAMYVKEDDLAAWLESCKENICQPSPRAVAQARREKESKP